MNPNQLEELEDELNEPDEFDELLYSPFSDIRIFNKSSTNQSIIGLLLRESDDSFLVGLPAKLVKESNGEIFVEEYIPIPYTRFLKTGISEVTPVFGIFEEYYLVYLEKIGFVKYPEYKDYFPEGLSDNFEDFVEEEKISEELETKLVEALSTGSILRTSKTVH